MREKEILNGRYELTDNLGTGGMAIVYSAKDLMLDRTVAIKILREDFSADTAFRERFRQEAKAAANLSHPNIVTVHDFGLDSGRLFIVMENVPGMDLKTIIQRRGRFSVDEALHLMIQACAGVGYAHRAGLIHCDIKPQNLLVTPDKRLKVTDFGIARALARINPEEKLDVVWGSPQYFSPEQAAGYPPSPASDVYSLGVVFYEMLTGQLPFIGTTATELARLHRETPPGPPSRLNPTIPPALERIMLKVLSKEPSGRYRTADQLGRVLINFSTAPEPTGRVQAIDPATQTAETLPTSPLKASFNTPGEHFTPASMGTSIVEDKPLPGKPGPGQTRRANMPAQTMQSPNSPSADFNEIAASKSNPLDIDWATWGLGLFALLAVGGLIPLWMWVYLLYK
jgi:eukaryotic-like serine/threonine-protein kinase